MDFLGPLRVLSTPISISISGTLFFATFLLYRWLLPKPFPGIPYNAHATKSIFGDIPDMINHLKTSKRMSDWLMAHNTRHNSPIVQVFTDLFSKPVVTINDYHECQDLLLRRTKEFDKPDYISDLFYGINPDFHTVQPTNDIFRSNRKLLQDLMTPTFLHGVAAPYLHASFVDLMKLWSVKMRLSEGRPFSFKKDIYETALDAIWAAFFGIEGAATVTRNQIEHLSSLKSVTLSPSTDEAVEFTHVEPPPAFEAILRLTDSIEHCAKSPFPRLTGVALRYFPSMRRHAQAKDRAITEQISKAEARMNQNNSDTGKITNAVDLMLRREKMAAEKQMRAPNYHSKAMRAELFGLLIAGHDTTSTTLLWGMKFFAAHQDVQRKLRTTLRTIFASAYSENRLPDAHEIVTSQIHYLDACVEEILRCGQIAPITSRTATTDAKVLGHIIPKGTLVVMCAMGGGILQPACKIDDNLRSSKYHNADGGKIGTWDPEDIGKFNPDRWLAHDAASNTMIFDHLAGPNIPFGGGPRGCFGKRLAYLELRLAIVLIIWSFELQPVPEAYASWEVIEQLTHSPVQCYVKLAKA